MTMKPVFALLVVSAACGTSAPDFEADVTTQMHDAIAAHLADLVQAATDLQAAAPADHGWDPATDAAAIAAMRAAWRRTRVAYELVEGVTAPIFPDEDLTMDARYDDFLARLGPPGDPDPFDATGVTGMHAIERILYADQIPANVIAFEATLPGYAPAAVPASAAEAHEFATELCQKLVDDATRLHAEWTPAAIDIGAAYQGLVGLMNEQKEKVNLAATGEEESRYAQTTRFDLRNNLAGTRQTYELFRPWVAAKHGDDADRAIEAGFDELEALYDAEPGDALPPVPYTWSSDRPSPDDLATPFGMLWQQVHEAVDPSSPGSVVFEMNEVAELLGFPEFVEQ
jgi:iron uptake system component EfeO